MAVLLSLRDKLFAHVDQGQNAFQSQEGTNFGKMLFRVSNGKLEPLMYTLDPRASTIENTKQIADKIRKTCGNKQIEILELYSDRLKHQQDGIYEVNIKDKGNAPLFLLSDAKES
jgi:hypothetical protein